MGSKKLAPCALLLTPIDVVPGQVGFKINGPGEVNNKRAWSRTGKHGGHEALRGRRRKRVARSDCYRLRVRRFQLVAFNLNNTAHDINIGMVENKGSVAKTFGF